DDDGAYADQVRGEQQLLGRRQRGVGSDKFEHRRSARGVLQVAQACRQARTTTGARPTGEQANGIRPSGSETLQRSATRGGRQATWDESEDWERRRQQ